MRASPLNRDAAVARLLTQSHAEPSDPASPNKVVRGRVDSDESCKENANARQSPLSSRLTPRRPVSVAPGRRTWDFVGHGKAQLNYNRPEANTTLNTYLESLLYTILYLFVNTRLKYEKWTIHSVITQEHTRPSVGTPPRALWCLGTVHAIIRTASRNSTLFFIGLISRVSRLCHPGAGLTAHTARAHSAHVALRLMPKPQYNFNGLTRHARLRRAAAAGLPRRRYPWGVPLGPTG